MNCIKGILVASLLSLLVLGAVHVFIFNGVKEFHFVLEGLTVLIFLSGVVILMSRWFNKQNN